MQFLNEIQFYFCVEVLSTMNVLDQENNAKVIWNRSIIFSGR